MHYMTLYIFTYLICSSILIWCLHMYIQASSAVLQLYFFVCILYIHAHMHHYNENIKTSTMILQTQLRKQLVT